MKNQIIYDQNEINIPANKILSFFPNCSIFAFFGILGAGKTSLIQNILKCCGVNEEIISPTYTYFCKYTNDINQTFYHFDLYRLSSLDEFLEMGFDEYLFAPNSWSFVEWPEIIMPLLTKKTCFIYIDYANSFNRKLSYNFSKDIQS